MPSFAGASTPQRLPGAPAQASPSCRRHQVQTRRGAAIFIAFCRPRRARRRRSESLPRECPEEAAPRVEAADSRRFTLIGANGNEPPYVRCRQRVEGRREGRSERGEIAQVFGEVGRRAFQAFRQANPAMRRMQRRRRMTSHARSPASMARAPSSQRKAGRIVVYYIYRRKAAALRAAMLIMSLHSAKRTGSYTAEKTCIYTVKAPRKGSCTFRNAKAYCLYAKPRHGRSAYAATIGDRRRRPERARIARAGRRLKKRHRNGQPYSVSWREEASQHIRGTAVSHRACGAE